MLDKDPKRRLRDIGEARIALEGALAGGPAAREVAAAPRAPHGRLGLPALLCAWALVTTGLATWLLVRPTAPQPRTPAPFTIPLQAGTSFNVTNMPSSIALSPDGTRLVFVGTRVGMRQLYVRPIEQLEATPIAGTEGAEAPFFSPDGVWIGFAADGKLKKVPIAGGAAIDALPGEQHSRRFLGSRRYDRLRSR